MKRIFLSLLLVLTPSGPLHASNVALLISEEHQGGYERDLFKHWVDADRNGCDTRKEVLILEAIKKPKKDQKCELVGGKWISYYDDKIYKEDSDLDIDHLVPLAEAWRSGAWQWTPEERQFFANDLKDSRVLIAVSASSNRSKGDKDPSKWLPKVSKEKVCEYILSWVAIKVRYSLTFDSIEANKIQETISKDPNCSRKAQVIKIKPLINWEKYKSAGKSTLQKEISPSPIESDRAIPSLLPSQSRGKPSHIKYKNCTEARAAGVTPIYRSVEPELYALNSALDRDKDGDACE